MKVQGEIERERRVKSNEFCVQGRGIIFPLREKTKKGVHLVEFCPRLGEMGSLDAELYFS